MPDVYKTTDNENFSIPGASPSQINQLIWQGLPGKYIAAADDGLYTTIDGGATWGALRPNTEFGTTWPGGAVAHQLAFSVGPNGGGNCNAVDDACQIFPVTFAAWNNTGGASTPFNGFTLQSEENNIVGIQTLADAFQGSNQDFLEYVTSISDDNTAIGGGGTVSYIEDGTIRTVILTVVSRATSGYPSIPSPSHAEMSNWNLIDTVTFGAKSRLSVFSARWDDTSLLPLTIDCGAVQEAITFSVRVLTGAAVSSPVIMSRSAHGIPSGGTFDIGINFAAPYTGDNHTWSVDDIDGGAGEGDIAGAAAIALEIQYCPSAYGVSFIATIPGGSGGGSSSFNNIDGNIRFIQQLNTFSNGPNMWAAIKEGINPWGNTQADFYDLNESDHGAWSVVTEVVQTISADDLIVLGVVANKASSTGIVSIVDTEAEMTFVKRHMHSNGTLFMEVWTAKSTATCAAIGTTLTIDYGGQVQDAITVIAVGLQNSTDPDNPIEGTGDGDFDGSGTGTENTPVSGSAPFSPGHDHIWGLNDFITSVAVSLSIQ